PSAFRQHCLCLLSCGAHRRYLYSFPTRRSSDLHGSVLVFGQPNEDLVLGQADAVLLAQLLVQLRAQQLGTAEVAAARSLVHGRQDRKSTRLNSSHVSISYAVFCLKKKKIRSDSS